MNLIKPIHSIIEKMIFSKQEIEVFLGNKIHKIIDCIDYYIIIPFKIMLKYNETISTSNTVKIILGT